MIEVLGFKRVMTIVALGFMAGGLAAALYLLVIPQKQKTERELRTIRSAVASRNIEIEKLKVEYQQIQEQKTLFETLQRAGYFGTQDRLRARKVIESIQAESKVLSAKYTIAAAEVKNDPSMAEVNHVVLRSPVDVTVDALDDMDIYKFMYWIENGFPGHAGITEFTLERRMDIDEALLRQVGNGVPTVLVNGKIKFAWNTMVPKDQVPQQIIQPSEVQ